MTFSFDMTEDPARFEEAVEEFARRRVVTREEADTLEGYAKKRVWWISGVAQMDIVQDAHESIVKAMTDGIAFEDWRKEIGPKLEKAWGRKDGHRILTIFRNATHQAYAAGRERQMRDPDVLALRPYHEFVAVEDLSECELCAQCNGVILPDDHPWWPWHTPQLHHCCRCQKRSLRAKTALGRGITPVPPEVTADEGFGLLPEETMPPKPVERKEPPDPAIHRELYLKQEKDAKARKPRKVKLKKEHSPKHWEEQYREKYGKAAIPVGYGRAVFERSKQVGLAETAETLTALEQAGVPGIRRLLVAAKTAAADASAVPAERVAAARLLAQHVRLLGMARDVPDMAKGTRTSTLKDALAKNRAWWARMSSGRLALPAVDWKKISANRGYYSPSRRAVHIGPRQIAETAVHEYAHAVEHIGNLAGKAKAFVAARTKGEPLRRLAVLLPGHGYGRDEVARPDEFISPYIGKEYSRSELSEVPSTLCGMLADGQLPEVLAKDPESAFFVLGWLVGS